MKASNKIHEHLAQASLRTKLFKYHLDKLMQQLGGDVGGICWCVERTQGHFPSPL